MISMEALFPGAARTGSRSAQDEIGTGGTQASVHELCWKLLRLNRECVSAAMREGRGKLHDGHRL